MATTESDYYELLGVSRAASDAEIKRAFRTLARELHPDVSSAPDAGSRFRDVAEAYEVLSDPARRATMTAGSRTSPRRVPVVVHGPREPATCWPRSSARTCSEGAGAAQRSQRGGDVQMVVEIGSRTSTGTELTVPVEVAAPWPLRRGRRRPGTDPVPADLRRRGVVRSVSQNIFGQFVQQRPPDATERARCSSGRAPSAAAIVLTRTTVEPTPAGIHDGQQIRVRAPVTRAFAARARQRVRRRPRPGRPALRPGRRRPRRFAHDDRRGARDDGPARRPGTVGSKWRPARSLATCGC